LTTPGRAVSAAEPVKIMHTGPLFDERMSDASFRIPDILQPDIRLCIYATSRIGQVAEIVGKLEWSLQRPLGKDNQSCKIVWRE
jgi:hypothetical protein